MIEASARTILRDQLARLVGGELTDAEFEDACDAHAWYRSNDRGVSAIARFGLELCQLGGEFRLRAYRLTGDDALSEETQRSASRCLLFLQSPLEYEWPDSPSEDITGGCLAGIACFWGFPLCIALALIGLAMLLDKDWNWCAGLGFCAALAGIVSIAIIAYWHKSSHDQQMLFESAGDFEVWPFFKHEDFLATSQSKLVDESA
jgi:hypothetical protein